MKLLHVLAALALLTPLAQAAEQITLRVGDQNYYNVRASVEASGVLEGAPYSVDWKHFQSAAPVAEGLDAGALDLGFLGDSGFIFLAAKGAPVKLIGVSRQNPDTIALLVPKDSPAKTIADLRGKKVAYWPGAWSQQLTLRALEKAGLPSDYVEFVKLMPIDAAAALPHLHPERRRKLLQSISEAAATASGWSSRQPAFFPHWVEKVDTAALPH